MTKVIKIPTSKITQFESKQIPTIEQENKIFKKDNIGTVVPSDALRNINLSTVPSVVQDAINAMGLSVETNILANALLLQIQRDIDNLGDAIVEKSYIDGQVSYLTSLLGQKSDVGDVASIVDSRIAIVTEDFATTAQVNNLNSRVGESESSITTLNQTINTKDAARATQIEEVEARVNQSLSNYTAVLNLTVDENGNVISQKIESLVAQNARANISIDENNKITLDENGNFTAYVAKFINDGHGNIVGFSFTDSDDAQSVFGINADVFQVSDATNRYTPFRIEDNNIYFNGKVTFSSIFSTDEEWQQQVQSAIDNNATTIDGGKIVTNQAFVNNLNAVGGVVADTITGNELNGIVINGARINGSVIKTSYLDLDGELEVLTNYHITVAMYNANPSLYTDAVYISADNEYRIPSMSIVREETKAVNLSSLNASSTSLIKPYNKANAGHNLKAVKTKPYIDFKGTILEISVSMPNYSTNNGTSESISYSATLYWLGINIGTFKVLAGTYWHTGEENTFTRYTKYYRNNIEITSFSTTVHGATFTAFFHAATNTNESSSISISISADNYYLPIDYTSGDLLKVTTVSNPIDNTWQQSGYTFSSNVIFRTSSTMQINNMI